MHLPALIGTLVLSAGAALGAQQAPALKIVVLEGEGAVNIIQQKTAVRPLVEVRDRNNVPVAGASVTFTIGGGGQTATFAGGTSTMTVTTNAAGQAAAAGVNPIAAGAVRIEVQAAHQGQTATAAISQTNVATAAAAAAAAAGAGAAAAGGGGSAASGAAAGAAGGGGGLSATTIGIIGAAAGGGALAATQALKKEPEGESFDSYNGSMNGQISWVSVVTNPQGQSSSCTFNYSIGGPLTIELFTGNATGRASAQFSLTFVSSGCLPGQPVNFGIQRENAAVSGGPSNLAFTTPVQMQNVTYTVRFTGSHSGNTITGTVTLNVASQQPASPTQPNISGSTSFPVTLTR